MESNVETEVVVLGAGPGGYTAAFRAADLGKKVTLIEYYDVLGGVCLNVGCIPSKALLHVAKILSETKSMDNMGISFSKPSIDIKKLRTWIEQNVIGRLTTGLKSLAKLRKINIIHGYGQFVNANQLNILNANGDTTSVKFEQAIIAVGSKPVSLPAIPQDPRIIDSTGALLLKDIPEKMLIIGGGIIGMEMATVYQALGSKVSIVELTSQLLPGVDKDLVNPLQKHMQPYFDKIMLNTKVAKVETKSEGLFVSFENTNNNQDKPQFERFDKILLSIGRKPNTDGLALDKAGVLIDDKGFIPVDKQQRTNINHIFAIGDVVGNPMLAHKAIPEGKIAAEVIAGKKHFFEPKCIPSVAYTDPEIAWVGITENEAQAKNINYGKGIFPWIASGRALSISRDEGMTKILFDKNTNNIIGVGIVGPNAGDLISEAALAIEMGCDAEDIALTIHPHPTLSEIICQAAEVFDGTITDLPPSKR